MLKVFKEGHVAVVTRGAYEDIYKPLGYTIASDKQVNEPEMVENNVEEKVIENDEVMVEAKETAEEVKEEAEQAEETAEETAEEKVEETEEVKEDKVDNEIKQNRRGK